MKDFIELNRTFHQLAAEFTNDAKNDSIDLIEGLNYRNGKSFHWDKLINEYRVIILAEAGAGKTSEIRNMTRRLRSDGKHAFFLRLEHISTGLDVAFEEGSFEEFRSWLASNEEGWVLLDSVDEARLKDVKDFERAIKRISLEISKAASRAHLFLTSRVTAWRPRSDLRICNSLFPILEKCDPPKGNAYDNNSQSLQAQTLVFPMSANETNVNSEFGFKVWSLTDLTRDQILTFLLAKGVNKSTDFIEEMERQDAWTFATRPQDLEEIFSFWKAKGRIGSRLELIRHSIERRLRERDQDRADSKPLSSDIARKGVQVLAAACVFSNNPAIRVPDGSIENIGLDVKNILRGWDDAACQALLSRPIFDEAIYGYVRFHHRSIREYLTAEWLSERLKENGSRKRVEDLFFRIQYDRHIIIASLRPVLSWLVLLDSKILDKVNKIDPEIILEGGDPSQLPLYLKKQILHRICLSIADKTSSNSIEENAAIHRFATRDLADDVKELLLKYHYDNKVISYLLRIIWQARIRELINEVMDIAFDSDRSDYTRIDAIRAILTIGPKEKFDLFISQFLKEKKKHSRTIVAEIIDSLDASEFSANWFFLALKNLEAKEDSFYDGLDHSLKRLIGRMEVDPSLVFIQRTFGLLKSEPLIERNLYEVSERYAWMIPFCVQLIEELIISKNIRVLTEECLFILAVMPLYGELYNIDVDLVKQDIRKLIIEWQELNYQLFWKCVEEIRRGMQKNSKSPLGSIWQVAVGGRYWDLYSMDFERLLDDVKNRPIIDDRNVALSFAFQLYIYAKRPKIMLSALKQSVIGDTELEKNLSSFLKPAAQSLEVKEMKKKTASWRRQDKRLDNKKVIERQKWVLWLNENISLLQHNNLKKGQISNAQSYLYNIICRKQGEGGVRLTSGNWQVLISEFGLPVAKAFRDGVIGYWRSNNPGLRSEIDYANKIEFGVMFGLSGIEIESKEVSSWPNHLSEAEAEVACRYAFHEINNFPDWFKSLHARFPNLVIRLILKEIRWEVSSEPKVGLHDYILSKVAWSNSWIWDEVGRQVLEMLKSEPVSHQDLTLLLKIVQKSTVVSDRELSELGMLKCSSQIPLDHLSNWFAVWIGVSPQPAIEALSLYLVDLNLANDILAKNFAMKTIVNLVGERRSRAASRGNYKEPRYLKRLYHLMHQYIRVSEDIHRLGKGVYSPELRDDAQDAREQLFAILKDIPGKETYLAISQLADLIPLENQRVRLSLYARERAQLDAEFTPWSIEKFVEFEEFLESVPRNDTELYHLAVQRLFDLKLDLEEGDESIASVLVKETEEKGIRKFIAGWCRDRASRRYMVTQEEELADARRPDCRFNSSLFDNPVPLELKLADKWTGSELFERLENQLCADYMRDSRSRYGIFMLVYSGRKKSWKILNAHDVSFSELIKSLQKHWELISTNYPQIEQVHVIGIDLTKRAL